MRQFQLKIVLVTKYFPPLNTIASHRLYSYAKYFPQHGIDVEIITPEWQGNLNFNMDKMTIHYTHEEKQKIQFSSSGNIFKSILKYTGIRAIRHYINSPFFKAGKTVSHSVFKNIDAVLVSFGPEDALHLAGYFCKKYKLPLIIDYRDLWLDNPFQNWTPLDKAIIYRLEKRILRQTVMTCTVSETLSQQLCHRYGQKAQLIYNGFWSSPSPPQPRLPKKNITFCYCGSLYGGMRPIRLLLPFLADHRQHRLVVAVFDDVDVKYLQNAAKKYGLTQQIQIKQNCSHQKALALGKQSDILLFLNTFDKNATGVLTGKLFEYMQSRRFILGIGNADDEAAKIIRRYNLGAYISKKDELKKAIEMYFSWSPPRFENLDFFSREQQAKRLAISLKETLNR